MEGSHRFQKQNGVGVGVNRGQIGEEETHLEREGHEMWEEGGCRAADISV